MPIDQLSWGRVPLLDYRKKGTVIPTSLLEDLVDILTREIILSFVFVSSRISATFAPCFLSWKCCLQAG